MRYVYAWAVELTMCFQDVAFLPSRACFATTFLRNCGRGEILGTTCLATVVGDQISQRSSDTHRVEVNLATLTWDITAFKTVVSVCLYAFIKQ